MDIIKILQLSEQMTNLCDNKNCNFSQRIQIRNAVDFINQNRPNVILWLSKLSTNITIFNEFYKKLNAKRDLVILPVYGQYNCSCPSLFNINGCYYIYSYEPYNISFIVLNTGVWLNEFKVNSSRKQLEWLKRELIDFRNKQRKIMIVGYDAPGSLETSSGTTRYATEANNALVELLYNYSSAISACIFGGGERIDSFRIIHNSEGKPILPLFILPINVVDSVSLIPNLRIYNFNTKKFVIDNYKQFHYNVTAKDGYNILYDMENVRVDQLFEFVESLPNVTYNFQNYYHLQFKNISFSTFCNNNNHISCVMCCSRCFIFNLVVTNLNNCLKHCSSLNINTKSKNNNIFYIIGVIVGFVVILLGIVLAVNKTYFINKNRQSNVFLAPLTLDIHLDGNDDIGGIKANGKIPTFKEIIVNNPTKSFNGQKSPNYESDQTYDYIRM